MNDDNENGDDTRADVPTDADAGGDSPPENTEDLNALDNCENTNDANPEKFGWREGMAAGIAGLTAATSPYAPLHEEYTPNINSETEIVQEYEGDIKTPQDILAEIGAKLQEGGDPDGFEWEIKNQAEMDALLSGQSEQVEQSDPPQTEQETLQPEDSE